jgi:predicted DNA-binding transcriptional regulator AlpA|nr:MAG TPA: putative transcriptional regulator [Caudoviricetes sp.]
MSWLLGAKALLRYPFCPAPRRVLFVWLSGSIPKPEIKPMQHQLQPDSLVDLKFIMADTGFGKTFIYDRIKDGILPKSRLIHGRARWLYSEHCAFKEKLLNRNDG